MSDTTTLFNGPRSQPVASGATLVYKAVLVDEDLTPIAASSLSSLALSIVDTQTGAVINSVDEVDILNADRGTLDNSGNLEITLLPEDTLTDLDQVDRSIKLKWVYGIEDKVGRHQAVFKIVKFPGD